MKQIYLTLVAAAAIAFSSVEANAFTVNEIVGKYTATDMDFSGFWGVFSSGNEQLEAPITWDDMEITIVEGNRIKVANFIKKGINNCKIGFDIEGDYNPATNTITFQPTGYEYDVSPYPFMKSIMRPMIAKDVTDEEFEAKILGESPEVLEPFTATFDDQKNLTVSPCTFYMRSKDMTTISRAGGTPKYKVGEAEVLGLYFTNNDNSGIEGVVAEDNAPAEYYNLQGIKVENPENGMYIRRQGGKATKVIVR